jgi:hypothetical protein
MIMDRMIHEYIPDPIILISALNAGHAFVPSLLTAADRLIGEDERCMEIVGK